MKPFRYGGLEHSDSVIVLITRPQLIPQYSQRFSSYRVPQPDQDRSAGQLDRVGGTPLQSGHAEPQVALDQ